MNKDDKYIDLDNIDKDECKHPIDRQIVMPEYNETLKESKLHIVCQLCGKILKTF